MTGEVVSIVLVKIYHSRHPGWNSIALLPLDHPLPFDYSPAISTALLSSRSEARDLMRPEFHQNKKISPFGRNDKRKRSFHIP
uniref:Uncharacterized protein n=1 Tax=Candidatus Kentrum sp. LPFa TaxID=2126335 RepID=A0A450W106_9GAMM|nr:MAG: hypothetical protein BECKLPF1236B_GA0070989_101527 [Candidatus Kentron sp. LPFa]